MGNKVSHSNSVIHGKSDLFPTYTVKAFMKTLVFPVVSETGYVHVIDMPINVHYFHTKLALFNLYVHGLLLKPNLCSQGQVG